MKNKWSQFEWWDLSECSCWVGTKPFHVSSHICKVFKKKIFLLLFFFGCMHGHTSGVISHLFHLRKDMKLKGVIKTDVNINPTSVQYVTNLTRRNDNNFTWDLLSWQAYRICKYVSGYIYGGITHCNYRILHNFVLCHHKYMTII